MPKKKRSKKQVPTQSTRDAVIPQEWRLPAELFTMILKEVNSPLALANAGCVCHAFRTEVEPRLYREIHVSLGVPRQLRSLQCALASSPHRASLVHILRVDDDRHAKSGCATFNKILPELVNLTDLQLNVEYCCTQPTLYNSILCTLNKCPFSLTSFACHTTRNKELKQFLDKQTQIESLVARHGHILDMVEWVLSNDALPNLRWLHTYDSFFVRNMQADRRKIAHLDWSLGHTYSGSMIHALSDQIVEFAYRRTFVCSSDYISHPTALFRDHELPHLKHLKVVDQIEEPMPWFPGLSHVEYMTRQPLTLETFTWVTVWETRRYRTTRLARYRDFVDAILTACPSLRFFYVERDDMGLHFILSFTMSEEGNIVEQDEASIPVWPEV